MNSVIQFCKTCPEHPFQDQRYGHRMRVMNPTGKLEKSGRCRCSVCNTEHDINDKVAVRAAKSTKK